MWPGQVDDRWGYRRLAGGTLAQNILCVDLAATLRPDGRSETDCFHVTAQGGVIEVLKARLEDGKKLSGGELIQAAGIQAGALLGG
jgi:hypothetical protein